MSSRKRSPRPLGLKKRKRRASIPLLENLEDRMLLSQINLDPPGVKHGDPLGLLPPSRTAPSHVEAPPWLPVAGQGSGSSPSSLPRAGSSPVAGPTFVLAHAPTAWPQAGAIPEQFSGPFFGFTPQQLQSAYGANQIDFGTVKGDGAGQTIAVIDGYDNPSFLDSSDPNYSTSTLAVYDKTFNLPDPPSFIKFDQNGIPISASNPGPGPPPPGSGDGVEIALDIEMVHAMAPEANIDLVEADNDGSNLSNLMQAAETAASKLGASVVSMSFGQYFESSAGGGAIEQGLDNTYLAPALAANPNVTFVAGSGDNGAPPGLEYPSASPLVVSVGGTSLFLNQQNQWSNETGWSGSGGGISNTFTEPTWQAGVQSTGFRTNPDVSADGNPNTGAAVYDPYDFGATTPWDEVGGTSLATPLWAGLIAIADQGRALAGGKPLDGPNQTLPALYSLPSSDYHDITVGNNGYSAGPGYDFVTGLGTPKADVLVPQLSAYGLATAVTVVTEPPPSLVTGDEFGIIVEAEDSAGVIDVSVNGTATLTLKSGPVGATFTPVEAKVTNGVAIFDGLSLSQLSSGTDYTFQVSISGLTTATTNPVDVIAATPGVQNFYPLPIGSANNLYAAVAAADANDDVTNIITLSISSIDYDVSQGQLLIDNASSLRSKSLTIVGQGESSSIIDAAASNRVFEINGMSSTLSVVFRNLSIEGGRATGGLPSASGLPVAVGGGLLIDGGKVALSSVMLSGNEAAGASGPAGASGASSGSGTGGAGGNGGNGGNARGGGIYMSAGNLSLTDDLIENNLAQGGTGGGGGRGGDGFTITPAGYFIGPHHSGNGGPGGAGGAGGSAAGGGLYVAGGTITINKDVFSGNNAHGGAGGSGGSGGIAGLFAANLFAGKGGGGGKGGNGYGGAVYLAQGSLPITSSEFNNNDAQGGTGGHGGRGGTGAVGAFGSGGTPGSGTSSGNGLPGGAGGAGQPGLTGGGGGNGGAAGSGDGGGLYIATGTVMLSHVSFAGNDAIGGQGGAGGTAGHGGPGGFGGTGGTGAAGANGSHAGANGGDGGIGGDGGTGGNGGPAGPAGDGGDGGRGSGGAVYMVRGSVVATDVKVESNHAIGGAGGIGGFGDEGGSGGVAGHGGTGGRGGNGAAGTVSAPNGGNGGAGGSGGSGGFAGHGGAGAPGGRGGTGSPGSGGGVFVSAGSLTFTSGSFTGNVATGGAGGPGGEGGFGGEVGTSFSAAAGFGGRGGAGGHGGNGESGTTSAVTGGNGGSGGGGGRGGNGGYAATGGNGGAGGAGGGGALGAGGGLYIAGGTVTVNNSPIESNDAFGGAGGAGGLGGFGGFDAYGGLAGTGGFGGSGGAGGGPWVNLVSGVGSPGNGGNGGNGGSGGSGGSGGFGGSGAVGGNGGTAGKGAGGGVYVSGGSVSFQADTIGQNQAGGGAGGPGGGGGRGGDALFGGSGGNGGQGGNGGVAGFLLVKNNHHSELIAGSGGAGGAGGNDGNGGVGGSGGSGGNAGNGGSGGSGDGGGLFITGGSITLNADTVSGNQAKGGPGGNGGNGGPGGSGFSGGYGGFGSSTSSGATTPVNNGGNGGALSASATKIISGMPGAGGTGGNGGSGGTGGNGGNGGHGGNGGNGGNGAGGGLFVSGGTLTVYNSTIADNKLTAGAGGSVGSGGSAGGVPTSNGQPMAAKGGPAGLGGRSNGGVGAQAPNGVAGRSGSVGHAGESGSSGTTPGKNGAGGAGGGMYVSGGAVTLYNATVALNRAGGVARAGGAVTAYNTIFAENTGGPDFKGSVTAYHSLFQTAPTGALTGSANLVNVASPGLSSTLHSNGGPTQTVALLAGSPAIGGGQNGFNGVFLFTDQRGFVPPAGVWDIGAYQYDAVPASSPTATLSAANVAVADYGQTTYKYSITYTSDAAIAAGSLPGAVVKVVPPGGVGSPITATVVSTIANGPTDPFGNAQSFTVTYKITPPGGQWTSADNGTYGVTLGGSSITDINGAPIAKGTVGTFQVETASLGFTPFGLIFNRETGFWSGTIKITNIGASSFTGPLFVVFSDLSSGAILENATGTYGGLFYLELSVGTVEANQTVSAVVTFNKSPVSYTPAFYIGGLGY